MEPMYMFPADEESRAGLVLNAANAPLFSYPLGLQTDVPVPQPAQPQAFFDGNVEMNASPEAWYAVQHPVMYDNFGMGNDSQLNHSQDQVSQWPANDNIASNGQWHDPMGVNVDVNYNYNYNVNDQVQYDNQWLNVNANEHYFQDQQHVNYEQPFAGNAQAQLGNVEYNYSNQVQDQNQWYNVNVNEQLPVHAPIDDNVNYNNKVQYGNQWFGFNANAYQDGFQDPQLVNYEPYTAGQIRMPYFVGNVYEMPTTPDEDEDDTGSAQESESPHTHRYILRSKGPAPPPEDSDDESDYSSDDEERDSFRPDQEPDAENESSGNAYIRCEWPRTDGRPCHKMLWVHLPPKGTKRVDAKDRQPSNNVYKHLLECKYHEDVKWELWKLPCKFGPECQGSSATMKCDGIGRHVTSTVSHLNRWIKYEKSVERDDKGAPTGKIRFTKVPLDMDEVDSHDEELLEKHKAARDVLYNPVRKVAVEL
ncbi:hypothetical protein CVT24_013219 [Panaeolus cyanescens]|uniref:Uncharacterized protein n=1 Tax=Panaeolus cyanescens TaxID=181874 RepID=A0A409YMX1_9AGAR|nr:hypothetical protein CVT24_013219 [Panaeolus cyanescens]